MKIRIGTRKSELALRQTRIVEELIRASFPDTEIEICPMVTKGDRILDVRLDKIGGKGLFIKELEDGMLRGETDIAVHSAKDVPHTMMEGMKLIAASRREDPRDALVSAKGYTVETLPEGCVIGTSSLRREKLFARLRPDAVFKQLRGNIHTRIDKMVRGEYDAIILANAGLKRMGITGVDVSPIGTDDMLPAAGQGIMCIEAGSGIDPDMENVIRESVEDVESASCLRAEREFMRMMNGSCSSAIASYATIDGDSMTIRAMYDTGEAAIFDEAEGSRYEPEALGASLAESIIFRIGGAPNE